MPRKKKNEKFNFVVVSRDNPDRLMFAPGYEAVYYGDAEGAESAVQAVANQFKSNNWEYIVIK